MTALDPLALINEVVDLPGDALHANPKAWAPQSTRGPAAFGIKEGVPAGHSQN